MEKRTCGTYAAYGGDFEGELTHDENFCCDGLVFADRSLKAESLEAKAAYQPIKTTYQDGKLIIYNRMDFTNLDEYEFTYWIEVDGCKGEETRKILSLEPHCCTEIEVNYEPVTCQFGVYLKGDLAKDGKVYAVIEHEMPVKYFGRNDFVDKVILTEDSKNIYANGQGFNYTFSKHYGMFTSLIVNGKEQLDGVPKLSAFRAPTDNERNIKQYWLNMNVWEGENLDCAFTKVYDCRIQDGSIIVEGSLAGVSRLPLFKYTLKVTILNDGEVRFDLKGDGRKDARWLQRLGYEFTLPVDAKVFSYYGKGPIESYCDMCHWATVGMYESTAEDEYVNYVYPQEHGNHNQVKMLRIGNLEFSSEQDIEIQVSEYSTHALLKATHTDELIKDGKIHLRIDYKNSGIGSASCGPELSEKYRLSEKQIAFTFSMKRREKHDN